MVAQVRTTVASRNGGLQLVIDDDYDPSNAVERDVVFRDELEGDEQLEALVGAFAEQQERTFRMIAQLAGVKYTDVDEKFGTVTNEVDGGLWKEGEVEKFDQEVCGGVW